MCGSKDPNKNSPRLDEQPPLLMERRFFRCPGFLVRNRKENTMNQSPAASIRILADNPNHHLWNNHGTFWCHYTLHLPDYTKRRVRQSLGTACVEKARRLRDQLLRRAVKGGAL
jgi:hypothetical protein